MLLLLRSSTYILPLIAADIFSIGAISLMLLWAKLIQVSAFIGESTSRADILLLSPDIALSLVQFFMLSRPVI